MNKRIKKLVLSRETLLNLSERNLQGVHGGVTRLCSAGPVPSECYTCEESCFSCVCTPSGCPPTYGC